MKCKQIGPITHIIPAGEQCLAAALLEQAGLRKQAYPFDWTQTTLGKVGECIGKRLSDYLLDTDSVDHPVYGQRFFIHHFSVKDRDALQRRIQRLLHVLDNPANSVLFVCTRKNGRLSEPELTSFVQAVARGNYKCSVAVLGLELHECAGPLRISKNCRVVSVTGLRPYGGTQMQSDQRAEVARYIRQLVSPNTRLQSAAVPLAPDSPSRNTRR